MISALVVEDDEAADVIDRDFGDHADQAMIAGADRQELADRGAGFIIGGGTGQPNLGFRAAHGKDMTERLDALVDASVLEVENLEGQSAPCFRQKS